MASHSSVPSNPATPVARRTAPWLLILLGLGVVGLLLWPFLPGLVLAAVLATLILPVHRRVLERVPWPGLAAFLSTSGVMLLLLLPLSALAVLVGTQALRGIEALSSGVPGLSTAGRGFLASVTGRFGLDPAALIGLLAEQLQRVASTLAARTLAFLSGLGGWLLQLGVALVVLYYLLRDSHQITRAFRRVIPLGSERVDELLKRTRDITHATVYGNLLVALVQGVLGGVAFRLVGLPAATLWGTIMGILALIPVMGPPVVWVPGVAYLLYQGELVEGALLTAIGALVIGTVDNLLRAVFVGGRARVHSLVVFLSVLGGVFVFGVVGLVVGPVLFVLALIALEAGRLAIESPVVGNIPDEERPDVEPTAVLSHDRERESESGG